MAQATSSNTFDFNYHPRYSFPPFFTPQPNVVTRRQQLEDWSSLIQSYCRHHRIFVLLLADALESPLFWNKTLSRRLGPVAAKDVLDWMSTPGGGHRVEWISDAKETCYVYWRMPEEWASVLADWVEETGQKNTVLTLYELTQGDNTLKQDFHDMDPIILQKSLQALVRRGKAQIFGGDGQQGVKFF
ncbi:MAG: hypothetical protein M1814_005755 [Vezdaea aestivalis]|nr:MAG: hypothetical protein M1814_005755 [Vezdaea aestivalis]